MNKNDNESYNPDILECLANLSNDEVFTPPKVANEMLDLLPQEIFQNPDATFLDPACKSGVFLREIAKRLLDGLKDKIPDLQERADHIFTKQLFGIAITELTGLLSRRSVYCAKYADSKYSVTRFESRVGNIFFNKTPHTFKDGKCVFCGASEEQYGSAQSGNEESHAYQFIHNASPEEIKEMHFDVIIGNPPYQMSDGGNAASAKPIYQLFVQQAKKLNPRYLVMIIPARWYAGGKGLDEFRDEMLKGNQIRIIHDFPIGADCFPGTRIAGGVCYFKWDRDNKGNCDFYSHEHTINSKDAISFMNRPLLEDNADTLIRINEAIPILRKVKNFNEPSFSSIVSARKPYGLPSDFFNDPKKYGLPQISKNIIENGIKIIGTYKYKTETRYVDKDYPFPNGKDSIEKYKVFISQVLDNGFDWTKERLNPVLGKQNEVCTETFLIIGANKDRQIVENTISYINTKFFHLLMFLKKISHHVTAKVYQFVPLQDFSHPWTDEMLYKKYNLSSDEIAFIEKMIRAMP